MPLEIRELYIKVNVSEPAPGGGAGAVVPKPGDAGEDKDQMIAQCIDEVLQVLKSKKER